MGRLSGTSRSASVVSVAATGARGVSGSWWGLVTLRATFLRRLSLHVVEGGPSRLRSTGTAGGGSARPPGPVQQGLLHRPVHSATLLSRPCQVPRLCALWSQNFCSLSPVLCSAPVWILCPRVWLANCLLPDVLCIQVALSSWFSMLLLFQGCCSRTRRRGPDSHREGKCDDSVAAAIGRRKDMATFVAGLRSSSHVQR